MANQKELLKKITEISFMVNDLNLYLDTHPLDPNALTAYQDAMTQRKQFMKTYGENFEPLTLDCVCPDNNNKTKTSTRYMDQKHFTWCDGPLPWEGGAC